MSINEIYALELQDLSLILEAWAKRREAEYEASWERTRFLALTMLTPYTKKGKKLRPTDIIQFPWDEKPKRASTEDLERISRMFGEG